MGKTPAQGHGLPGQEDEGGRRGGKGSQEVTPAHETIREREGTMTGCYTPGAKMRPRVVPPAAVAASPHARKIPRGDHRSQRPRVKSGKAAGRLPLATDHSVRGPTAESAAASYTFMSVGCPSRRHFTSR